MILVECINSLPVHYGTAFTEGKKYYLEKFNEINGIKTYHAVNDFGNCHLLGQLDDELLNYFKII